MREIPNTDNEPKFQLGRRIPTGRPSQSEKIRKFQASGQAESEVLRFLKSERMLHWAIAVPFVVCWITALILVLVYNPDPLRPYRQIVSLLHRISGACLILLPILALMLGRKERKVHFENVRTALSWSMNDIKWMALMLPAAVSKNIVLPEQGKFNAAEKVNFTMVMLSVPLLISSGVLVWMGSWAWAAWVVHALTAILATPTMLGHIYMATVNPETRVGIKGMITGYVDRRWAKHHYAVWYRECFENKQGGNKVNKEPGREQYVHLSCPKCSAKLSVRWSWLVPRIVAAVGVFCPSCGEQFSPSDGLTDAHNVRWGAYLLKNEPGEGVQANEVRDAMRN
jgi:formate dehydrogenase subunit gamma